MRTMLRFTAALVFAAFAVPALAAGRGNDGIEDESLRPAPTPYRLAARAALEISPGHGNDGLELEVPSADRGAVRGEMAYERMPADASRGRTIARFVDRTHDAGG